MTPIEDRPEISDLVVAFDPETLARMPVRRDEVLCELERHGMPSAARIVGSWPHDRGILDAGFVDGVLARAHGELQRLSEEFQQGQRAQRLLAPTLATLRGSGVAPPYRIVDVGCGLGYVIRWLAARGELGSDVELIGCDYNASLIALARGLAERERLRCRFDVANAFRPAHPATIFMSTGVIHHFRGRDLDRFLGEQARAGYHAHPNRNLAGAGERRYLDRLPCSCSKWRMRVPSVSQIRTWVLAPMKRLWSQLAPRKQASEIAGIVVDTVRTRRELVLENAVLRHQVNVLRRRSKRPKLHFVDRLKLLLGARWLPAWRRAIVLVKPETVLRWHRAGFRRFWRRRSRPRRMSPLPPETIDLIRDMAVRGRLWGAERIRGELLKLGIKVSKRTIQKYMREGRGKSGDSQRWATFVKNHAERMWVCDFIQTHDLLFRQVYAFFIVHLASRRVVHVAATRHPTQAWTAQQLRNATMDGDAPAVLLRDRG